MKKATRTRVPKLKIERVPEPRRFRYVNAGEVTLWQKKVCWESGLLPPDAGARLVWVREADIIDLGVEVNKER